MEIKDTPSKIKDNELSQLNKSKNKLKNLKSDYFIQKFFDYIHKIKSLEIIKYKKISKKGCI